MHTEFYRAASGRLQRDFYEVKEMKHKELRALCEGAIMVAAAQGLSYLKLWHMPWGGSVTLGMLPVFLYCARWGFCRGMLASTALSVLQLLLDFTASVSWKSVVGDYLLAYSVIGLAGLTHSRRFGFFSGGALGSFARFLVHWIVGATVWAEYMPETFLNLPMTSPWVYSAIYNALYVGLSAAACLAAGLLLWKPLGKYIRGEDLNADVRQPDARSPQ